MKKITFTLLTALFLTASASFFTVADGQEQQSPKPPQTQGQQQQTQRQAQQQPQTQGQQQQTQRQAQQQPQNQGQQPQTQQQVQQPTQNQGQQQQTQQQAQQPTQSQGQRQQTQQQAQQPTQNQNQQPNTAYVKVGPHWKVGTTWRVETLNIQKQGTVQKQSKPVVWVFTVVGETKIGNRGCFEVAIRCQDDSDRQPRVSIWVDKVSGMLMRVTSMMLVKGQWRTVTETYAVPEGKSVAVLGSIPSLPLDMPLFTVETGSKDLDGMTYEVVTGAKGSKNLGEIGFTYTLDQSITPASEERSKELAGAKALDAPINLKDAVEIELKNGPSKRIRQLWTPGNPWPVYSTNGTSESRLLDVTRPQ